MKEKKDKNGTTHGHNVMELLYFYETNKYFKLALKILSKNAYVTDVVK